MHKWEWALKWASPRSPKHDELSHWTISNCAVFLSAIRSAIEDHAIECLHVFVTVSNALWSQLTVAKMRYNKRNFNIGNHIINGRISYIIRLCGVFSTQQLIFVGKLFQQCFAFGERFRCGIGGFALRCQL